MRLRAAILCLSVSAGAASIAAAEDPAAERTGPAMLTAAGDIPQRMSLDHWPKSGWSVQQHLRNVEIRFFDSAFAIDTTRLPLSSMRGLVAEVSSETGSGESVLRIVLDCDCTLALHGSEQTGLAIDVMAKDRLADLPPAAGNAGPAPLFAPQPLARPGITELGDASDQTTPLGVAPLDVEAAREHLMKQLLRAADAGIVTMENEGADTTTPHPSADAPEQSDSPPAPDQAAPSPALSTPGNASSPPVQTVKAHGEGPGDAVPDKTPDLPVEHVVVDEPEPHTASSEASDADHLPDPNGTADDDKRRAELAARPSANGCFPNEAFGLSSPHDRTELVREISKQRQALVGEFDKPNSDAAIRLAKLYLVAEMAVEARAILASFGAGHPLTRLHDEIAELIAGNPLAEGAILLNPECLGDHALWRAFAEATAGNAEEALRAERSAGRALERADSHVRELISSRIGLAATEIGDWSVARRMEAMAKRSGASSLFPRPETAMLEARLARWNGDTDTAVRKLHELRKQGQPLAEEALFTFAEMVLSGEASVLDNGQGLQLDLGAVAHDYRGTPTGQRALDLEVRFADRFTSRAAAIDLLSIGADAGQITPDIFVDKVTKLVSKASAVEDDRPLALIYLDNPARLAPALEQGAFRRALARSMGDIGTPGLARDILQDTDMQDAGLVSTLASAFIDAGEPREALDFASYLPESAEKTRITNEALLALGQPGQVVSNLRDPVTGDDPVANRTRARAALSIGDWPVAVEALEKELEHRPDPIVAGQLAMAALQAGHDKLPEIAERVLSETASERLEWFRALFGDELPQSLKDDPGELTEFLQSLEAETTAIQEILNDG